MVLWKAPVTVFWMAPLRASWRGLWMAPLTDPSTAPWKAREMARETAILTVDSTLARATAISTGAMSWAHETER